MQPSIWISPAAASAVVLASAVATGTLIVVLRPVLVRYALARPNARSSHKVPTPQGGGVAIIAVTIAAVSVAVAVEPLLCPARSIALVLGAAAALAAVGAADDVIVLRALPRLGCQLVAAIAVLAALPDGARVIGDLPIWLERGLIAISLVWFVNLVNFMDGIDWITVAEVVPIAGGVAVIAALGHAPQVAFVVASALGGATLGFAPFNRPIAKLFLGDVGSLPIGLLLGWLLLLVAASGHLAAAVLMPLYYVADSTITLGRRLSSGERVWEAHRTHFYQRATDHGFSVIEIVARVFVINLALVGLAVWSVLSPGTWVQIAALGGGALAVAWLLIAFARRRR